MQALFHSSGVFLLQAVVASATGQAPLQPAKSVEAPAPGSLANAPTSPILAGVSSVFIGGWYVFLNSLLVIIS